MKIQLNKIIQYSLVLAIGAIGFTACNDRFERINTDPNESSTTATSFLLSNAQKFMMDYTWDEWFNGRRGNQLAQYWASNQYSQESRYAFRPGITNTYWGFFYSRPLLDLQEIIRLNEESPADYVGYGSTANQIAIAKTLQAWLYQNMTDTWGPIPFSQALKGAEFPNPAYDSQEEVYMGLLAMLDDAINSIDEADVSVRGDLIYDGDMSKWAKFANSLKLRVALRMADVKPAEAATAAAEAISGGLMTSNDDNALFRYVNGAPNNNPISEDFKTRNDFSASNTMVDELLRLNDPRVGFYYSPTVNGGNFVGEEYGLTEADAAATLDDDISQRNPSVLAEDAAGIYLDYAQVEFMLAEAAERGIAGAGAPADHYNAGIEASMMYWNDGSVDATDIANYIATPEVDYATQLATQTWREVIGRQKWIALYMQGIQGWTEYRRLDFGILQAPAGGSLGSSSDVPNRLTYPTDEQLLNEEQYQAGVALLDGLDDQNTKLWWDVN